MVIEPHVRGDVWLLSPFPVDAIGSAREGLYSVFRRTCEHNQLNVTDVVSRLVLPLAGPSPERLHKLIKPLHLINSGSGLTDRFIHRMTEISVVSNLSYATLKELNNLPGISPAYLKPYRCWCPHCYSDDCGKSHGPYDRLLWSLGYVEACPVHNVRLATTCAFCGAAKMPVLMGYDLSGFCPHCKNFLGTPSPCLTPDTDDHSRYLIWTAKSFAGLLDVPIALSQEGDSRILEVIRKLTDFHFNGAYSRFAHAISRNKSVVGTWFSKRAYPGWRALCEISFSFHIPLRDLLVGESGSVEVSAIRPLPLAVRQRNLQQRKLPQVRDTEAMRAFIIEVANGKYPKLLTVRDVALRLEIDASDLRKRCRDEVLNLSKILKNRRDLIGARKAESRERDLDDAISVVGADLAMNNGPVTRRYVESKLMQLGIHVARADSKAVRQRVADAKISASRTMSGNC